MRANSAAVLAAERISGKDYALVHRLAPQPALYASAYGACYNHQLAGFGVPAPDQHVNGVFRHESPMRNRTPLGPSAHATLIGALDIGAVWLNTVSTPCASRYRCWMPIARQSPRWRHVSQCSRTGAGTPRECTHFSRPVLAIHIYSVVAPPGWGIHTSGLLPTMQAGDVALGQGACSDDTRVWVTLEMLGMMAASRANAQGAAHVLMK
jgi:hypothetical protein